MKRMKKLTFGTLSLVGLFTAAALAWFVLGTVSGTGTTKAGKAAPTNVNIKTTIPEGVSPTASEPITMEVENNVPGAVEIGITKLAFTIKDSNEAACPVSNLSIKSVSKSSYWEPILTAGGTITPTIMVKAGEVTKEIGTGDDATLFMAATAPTGCESVTVTVTVVATHT